VRGRGPAARSVPDPTPRSPSGVGVVVLPDVRGLHDEYRDLAVGFCVGGGYSWSQAADAPGLSGAIGF